MMFSDMVREFDYHGPFQITILLLPKSAMVFSTT